MDKLTYRLDTGKNAWSIALEKQNHDIISILNSDKIQRLFTDTALYNRHDIEQFLSRTNMGLKIVEPTCSKETLEIMNNQIITENDLSIPEGLFLKYYYYWDSAM